MNVLLRIKEVIDTAKKNNVSLNFQETILAMDAIKEITSNASAIEKIINILSEVNQPTNATKKLTKREYQIFNLIGVGLKSKEIATALTISKKTVSTHRKNIIKKINGHGSLQEMAFKHVHDKLRN